MTQPDQPLLKEAEQYVRNLFSSKTSKYLAFHNLKHTMDVVGYCETIATSYQLNATDRLELLLAAWFHDTGYLNGTPKEHEEQSQKIATSFLQQKNVDQQVIDAVNAAILATRMPQAPSNLIEQILCDADLYHLGTDDFVEKNKLLRQEVSGNYDHEISKREWRQINIEFLQRHRYFTEFAKEKLEPIKRKHLLRLIEKQSKKEKSGAEENGDQSVFAAEPVGPEAATETSIAVEKVEEKNKIEKDIRDLRKDIKNTKDDKKDDKAKQNRTDRGVVAMFRIMSDNHVNLSHMADSKANILISVNTIVISILVSVLLGKLQFYPEYTIPAIMLVLICLVAAVFAILATRPNISGGTFTREDIQNKKINLLFFGNFFKMELGEYDWAMKEMMNDREYLYGSMIKDIYYLGLVLARKYKLLRISYNVFMYGLIAAIIAFGIAFFISKKGMGE
jgi:predicted metal-dependent HD superfamily phosphohydrolase